MGLALDELQLSDRGSWHLRVAGAAGPLDVELGRDDPAAAVARVSGSDAAVAALLGQLDLPDGAEVLGPTPRERPPGPVRPGAEDPGVSALVRAPLAQRADLARALRAALSLRSARKDAGTVRVELDPEEVL